MKESNISRRKFLQVIGAFIALFSLGGITSLFSASDESTKSGYGKSGYGK
jgi:hypothetical protein